MEKKPKPQNIHICPRYGDWELDEYFLNTCTSTPIYIHQENFLPSYFQFFFLECILNFNT